MSVLSCILWHRIWCWWRHWTSVSIRHIWWLQWGNGRLLLHLFNFHIFQLNLWIKTERGWTAMGTKCYYYWIIWIVTIGFFLSFIPNSSNKVFYPIKILLHCTLYSHSHTCVCSWMGSAWEYMVSFRSLQNFPYLQPYFQWLCHPIFTGIMLFNLFKGHLYLLLIWQKHKPLSKIQQNSLFKAQKYPDIPSILLQFC